MRKRLYCILLILGVLLSFIPGEAYAQVTDGTCLNGDYVEILPAIAELHDRGIGGAVANPLACNIDGWAIISGTICVVRTIIARSMFEVYCSILFAWQPIIQIALILYIIFYAIAFTFGINNASLKDAVIRYIKISIIFWFATDMEFFYFWVYSMFIGFLDGYSIMLITALAADPSASGVVTSSGAVATTQAGVFEFIDVMFEGTVGRDNLRLLAGMFFAVLVAAFGFGFVLGLFILTGIIAMLQAFLQLLVTYVTAIMFIAFLLMFTPIFLTAALFSKTMRMFTRWLAALISYTLQPVLVLTFIYVVAEALSVASLGQGNFEIDKSRILCDLDQLLKIQH